MPSSSSEPLRHNPDYRLLWLGQTLSLIGSQSSQLARSFPGETRYLEEVGPASIADLVVTTS